MHHCLFAALSLSTAAAVDYPDTRRDDTVDTLHGVKVADPYRWLEDDNSEETARWVAAQNKVTFAHLAKIPARKPIKARLTELWDYERVGTPFKVGDRYFFSRNSGLQSQSVLYTGDSLEAEPRILLDPNTLSADGTVALSGYSVSPDGNKLAYAISRSGSDWKEWQVRDVATGEDLEDHVKWSKFSGASWSADNTGFYYSRYDEPKEGDELSGTNFFQKLYFHKVGSPQANDRLVYQRPDEKKWSFGGMATEDGRFLVIDVWRGSASENAVFYQDLGANDKPAAITPLLPKFDAKYDFVGNDGDTLWFRTDLDAPRGRLIAIDINKPAREHWREVISQSADTLRGASVVGDSFVASYMQDAHTVVRRFSLEGKALGEITLPGIGTARGFSGRREHRETFYSFSSFTTPPTTYRYDFDNGQSTLHRAPKLKFDPTAFETKQVFFKSKDGTRVPMFIVSKKGVALDGNNPTLLYAYGGFNISLLPRFSTSVLSWLEMGGVYAVANLRGGGEYGEGWHEAGMKLNKQNVFDDFIAAAEWLISNKYTSRQKLAISGGSNGGLLVGACMTQRPELFKACLPAVGVMDMLRFHKFTIGWAWASEYGSAENAEEFAYLRNYSPYHNLQPGTKYPATMVTTGDHDDRVVPAHSFKFAAALQRAHAGGNPVVIRIETKAGHGAGKPTDKIIAETADKWAFLHRELGMGGAKLPIDALTFNIRYDNPRDEENAWPKREEMVGEWLASELPDVVGLQEAMRHQIDDILETVPAYAEYGVGRDDGKSKGEHCTILYKADRFEPGEGGTFWLSDTPEKIASSSWGNEIPRICTWLHLTDKTTKRGFYVYNAHWDHRSQASRERAATLIAGRILARKTTTDPIILMGDFNAAENNPAITNLKKHFVDSFRIPHPDEEFVRTFNGFKGGRAKGGKIDHIFILPESADVESAEIVRYNRDGRYLSDHYPVRAKLAFR